MQKMERTAPGSETSAGTIIVFTGERRNKRHLVRVYDRALMLTGGEMGLLVRLVLARGTTPAGFLAERPLAIHRLRQKCAGASGRDGKPALIETGCGQEYRLALEREELPARIAIEPGFFELVDLGVLTKGQAGALRRQCGMAGRR
jgi:hypothetical protein